MRNRALSSTAPPVLSKYTSMPIRRRVLERRSELGVLVVDGDVEAELVDEHPAFVVGAGDADDAAPMDLGDLADDVPDRPRRRRDDDGLARLRLADLEQSEVRGQPVGAEHPERCGGIGIGVE